MPIDRPEDEREALAKLVRGSIFDRMEANLCHGEICAVNPCACATCVADDLSAAGYTRDGSASDMVADGDGWTPLKYARQLATSLAAKYPDRHPDWEPLPDLMGLLSQIDNATTGLVYPPKPAAPVDVHETAFGATQTGLSCVDEAQAAPVVTEAMVEEALRAYWTATWAKEGNLSCMRAALEAALREAGR